jgi:hypothetical protein
VAGKRQMASFAINGIRSFTLCGTFLLIDGRKETRGETGQPDFDFLPEFRYGGSPDFAAVLMKCLEWLNKRPFNLLVLLCWGLGDKRLDTSANMRIC